MRFWFYILGLATLFAGTGMLFSATSGRSVAKDANIAVRPATAWEFRLTSIDGKPMPLEQYRGRVLLVVNTASFCGFTPQYEGLQKLHETFGPKGLTVIGVPSGDFREQEYADNAEIREFCESKFGIAFPMTEKSVVTGADAIPLYQWARTGLSEQNVPKWNFHKFLIGRDGRLIAGFPSKVAPDSPELVTALENALRGS